MFTYRLKGNKIYHYSICDFKGMNVETARKEYIKIRKITIRLEEAFLYTLALAIKKFKDYKTGEEEGE